MDILSTSLPGLLLLKPTAHRDERGFFFESWQSDRYLSAEIPDKPWVQDNVSSSKKGVLRGLHFQSPRGQGKLVSVLHGDIYDVVVDIRQGSPTFGKHVGIHLSTNNFQQLWIPSGFAHGFLVLSEWAIVSYKASERYHPEEEKTLLWNDPELAISWPVPNQSLLLSHKDKCGKPLSAFSKTDLPSFT